MIHRWYLLYVASPTHSTALKLPPEQHVGMVRTSNVLPHVPAIEQKDCVQLAFQSRSLSDLLWTANPYCQQTWQSIPRHQWEPNVCSPPYPWLCHASVDRCELHPSLQLLVIIPEHQASILHHAWQWHRQVLPRSRSHGMEPLHGNCQNHGPNCDNLRPTNTHCSPPECHPLL